MLPCDLVPLSLIIYFRNWRRPFITPEFSPICFCVSTHRRNTLYSVEGADEKRLFCIASHETLFEINFLKSRQWGLALF